jgi:probable rRNA maturation factor
MSRVSFYSEDLVFNLPKPRKTSKWIKNVIADERKELGAINYIFCSDRFLEAMNIQYLNHKDLTDIITFDNSESQEIEGDIYISIDRVRENAITFKTSFQHELHRVIIHGVLHLLGYSDKTAAKKAEMRNKEDACLSLPTVPRETFK